MHNMAERRICLGRSIPFHRMKKLPRYLVPSRLHNCCRFALEEYHMPEARYSMYVVRGTYCFNVCSLADASVRALPWVHSRTCWMHNFFFCLDMPNFIHFNSGLTVATHQGAPTAGELYRRFVSLRSAASAGGAETLPYGTNPVLMGCELNGLHRRSDDYDICVS